ncbi:MAG: ester cyclase [Deltaproteobacteria bacterium]|nr:ester cyclase [Deltaproteobacteria bacterium]
MTDPSSVHERLVRRYFHEVFDQGKVDVVEELFHPQCVMHRPGGTVDGLDAVRGVAEHRKETYAQFKTEIHDVFGSADRLVARLSHRGVGCGIWRSRFGSYDVSGKTVTWDAIAIFRFDNDRIIEEWVTRDELGMILQFGLVKQTPEVR